MPDKKKKVVEFDDDRALIVEGVVTPEDIKKIFIIVGVAILVWFSLGVYNRIRMGKEIPIVEAIELVVKGEAKKAIIKDNHVQIEKNNSEKVHALIDSKSSFLELLQRDGVKLSELKTEITSPVAVGITIYDVINVLFLVAVIVGIYKFLGIISKQMGGGGIMSFGKSPAKVIIGKRPDVTFKDVAGLKEAKLEISEIVEFLKEPKKFFEMGARIPRGLLLVGDPGAGKTLLARAVAGEAKVPFFSTSGPEFEEMLVGAGAARVRDLFRRAKNIAPSIIFIDEIDAVARKRGIDLRSSNSEQTLNQILVEMDGFEKREAVIVIAATNRPDVLDPAVLRPGRFDRRIELEMPDSLERRQILKIHSKNKKLSKEISLKRIADLTVGFSGADLENLMNEAAILAVRAGHESITPEDLNEAVFKVSMGSQRGSKVITEEDLRNTAWHEAGHAIVSAFLPQAERVRTISIVPRGRALGFTYSKDDIDKVNENVASLKAKIAVATAGRIAELMLNGEEFVTTGAGGDIEHATKVARAMVQYFGMSKQLGFLKYGGDEEVSLVSLKPDFSQATHSSIDSEVKAIVTEQYAVAKKLLEREKKLLEELANELLRKETLNEKQFEEVVSKYATEAPPEKPKHIVQSVKKWIKKAG